MYRTSEVSDSNPILENGTKVYVVKKGYGSGYAYHFQRIHFKMYKGEVVEHLYFDTYHCKEILPNMSVKKEKCTLGVDMFLDKDEAEKVYNYLIRHSHTAAFGMEKKQQISIEIPLEICNSCSQPIRFGRCNCTE